MPRTWLIAAIVLVPSALALLTFSDLYTTSSVWDPNMASSPPRFQVHSFVGVPVLIAMFGSVFLTFDTRQRDIRDRISEVLDTKSLPNLALVAGRVLACAFAALVPVWGFCLIAQIAGVIDQTVGWSMLAPFESISFIKFSLFYAPLTIVVWCAVTSLIGTVVPNRWAVAMLSVLLWYGLAWVIVRIPFGLYPLFIGLPGIGEPASDILLGRPSIQDVQRCFGLLLVAAGALALTAAAYPRRDQLWTKLYLPLASASLLLSGVNYTLLGLTGISTSEMWRAAHQAAATAPQLDLEHISGIVVLNPGAGMQVDVELILRSRSAVRVSDVVFSLNPGLMIDELKVNGEDTSFVHENGLLSLTTPDKLATDREMVVSVNAIGVPDPEFAYLDSAIDPKRESLWSSALYPLGVQGSLFTDRYIALPPGVFWLPLPGANYGYEDPRIRSRDFYTVNLDVEVPDTWIVAAPGSRTESEAERPEYVRYQFRHEHPLPSVGLFASKFVAHSKSISGIDFEILLHPRHLSSAEFFAGKLDAISELVSDRIEYWQSRGLALPCDTFRLVEVPAALRSYGGGLLMGSVQTLPCAFLLSEHGFPTARFAAYWERSQSWQSHLTDKDRLQTLFINHFHTNYIGGNLLAEVNRNLFQFQTGVHGDGALELELLVADLIQTQSPNPDLAMASPHALIRREHSDSNLHSFLSPHQFKPLWAFFSLPIGELYEGAPFESLAVWEHATGRLMPNTSTYDAEFLDVAALHMRSATMAVAASLAAEPGSIAQLLSDLRQRFSGSTMSADEFFAIVREREIASITPPDSWLKQREFPGFVVSRPRAVRLPDDEEGRPQYQSTIHIRNNEPAAGTALVFFRDVRSIPMTVMRMNSDWPRFLPVTVPGETSVECGWVSDQALEFVIVQPVSLSLHGTPGRGLVASVSPPDADEIVRMEAFVGQRPSDWMPQPERGIVVDDLDEGFSTGRIRSRNPAEADQARSHKGTLHPAWVRTDYPGAWGTYRRSVATSLPDEGRNEAMFSSNLPSQGKWRLSYHIPEFHRHWIVQDTGVRSSSFRNTLTIDVSGTLRFHIQTAESSHDIDVVVPRGFSGWIDVGEFAVGPGPADVVVSKIIPSRDPYDVLVADAIRWRTTEESSEVSLLEN